MRSILLLVLGLVIGALGAVKVNNVLRMRDAYPRGVMTVMSHHMGELVHTVRQGKCPAATTQVQLQRIAAMQPEILSAFAGNLATKPDFRKHAQKLATAVQDAVAAAPAACPALGKALSRIGGSCKSCHEIYR